MSDTTQEDVPFWLAPTRLRLLRESCELTVDEFGAMFGVSGRTVLRIERGDATSSRLLYDLACVAQRPLRPEDGYRVRSLLHDPYLRRRLFLAHLALLEALSRQDQAVAFVRDQVPLDHQSWEPIRWGTPLEAYEEAEKVKPRPAPKLRQPKSSLHTRHERKLLEFVRGRPDGASRRDIYRLFSNKLDKAQIGELVAPLCEIGLLREEPVGRGLLLFPTERLLSKGP